MVNSLKSLFTFLVLINFSLSFAQASKVESIKEFQDKINSEFKDPEESPLTAEDLKLFKAWISLK
ncbi:hypothetical protein [Gillisia lutea]|uniref:hypothetical protein n=1 Tax=Gillisia lutea TaxID=2909668 RepID=UPI0027E50579|nr:hypothetical protein [Gillisia lutea]